MIAEICVISQSIFLIKEGHYDNPEAFNLMYSVKPPENLINLIPYGAYF